MQTKWRHIAAAVVMSTLGLGCFLGADAARAANDRVEIPEDASPPFYVLGINDDEWAAIFFIRDVACTPAHVNLLGFPGPAVFACPLVVEGHAIIDRDGAGPPRMFHLEQAAPMEAWLVSTEEFGTAMSDGVLTKAEVAALPSLLIGAVERYTSTHHFKAGAQSVAGSVTGTLADGRRFSVHASTNQREASSFPRQLFCGCSTTGPVNITIG